MNRWLSTLCGVIMLALIALPVSAQQDLIDIPADDTLRLAGTLFPVTLDPLFATSTTDTQFAVNLFMGLVRIDPQTGNVRPGLAQSWDVSDDGLTWTFILRDDIFWVRYNPETGQVEAERPVNAVDVYGALNRLCSPIANTYYTRDVFGPIIATCADGQAQPGEFMSDFPEFENIVTIQLVEPIPYFPMLMALSAIAPIDSSLTESYGADWTQPQNILTSGAFALADWQPNTALTLVANPFLPSDLRGDGNISRVTYTRLLDTATVFRLFTEGLLDRAPIPAPLVETVLNDEAYTGRAFTVPTSAVYFIGFDTSQPPFDDIHLRRAFAAVLDREAFVRDVRGGRGISLFHLIPEELNGAPPRFYDGLTSYNTDYARQQLALSGYAGCAGLPDVEVYTYEGAGGWVSYLRDAVQLELGCAEVVFNIIELPFDDLRSAINPTTPNAQRPQMFTFGFGADYNDASTFGDVVLCGDGNYFGRQTCTPTDDFIRQANRSDDPATRESLYSQGMIALFGAEGEWPLIPLFQLERYFAVQGWLNGPFEAEGRFDVMHFDAYTLDAAQRAEGTVCLVSAIEGEVNLRGGPGINFDRVATLPAGREFRAVGQIRGADSFTWWYLETGVYVRDDVVNAEGLCRALPILPG